MTRFLFTFLVLALPGLASAASYAALDEAPATGGELRLVAPRSSATPGQPGTVVGFPLQNTDVAVEIDGVMAHVIVEQTFENPYAEVLDAVYVFPLGPDAAVNAYELEIGERLVRGEIAEREEARQRFEEARSNGQTAGLLQQEKPNVFTQEVANVPPGESIVVRFEYVELADYYDGEFEFVFPMVVGPRYLPGSTSDPRPVVGLPAGQTAPPGTTGVSFLPPGQRSGHDIDIDVRLDPGVPVHSFASTSHSLVDGGLSGTEQALSLDPAHVLADRDFVLRWSTAGSQTLIGALSHKADRDGYLSLLVHPKADYTTGDVAPREVILLMDRSGSMGGQPMQAARRIAHDLLGALRPQDRINILAFSDGVDSFRPDPVPADAATVAEAQRWVAGISTGGGTQMLNGLRGAIAAPANSESVRVVYLLSDGEVGNDDEILGSLDRNAPGLRIYPIGIGSAPNRYLFERTAERARGFASYVASSHDLEGAVATLIERSTRPYLTDLEVDWGGLDVRDVTPAALPDVQAGEPLVLSARYRKAGQGTVVLKATHAGRRVEIPLDLELADSADEPGVAYLWARRRIHELKTESLGKPDRGAKREITDLGMQFGLVTDYTSYVAIDQSRTLNRTGARTVTQAVDLPDGTSWNGVFGGQAPQASPTVVASNTPQASRSSSSSSTPSRSRRGGSFGGGDLDPISGLILLGLAAAARRRKQRESDGEA